MEIIYSENLLAEAAKQGLWAILYVSLFVYTLRESRRQQDLAKARENRLREEYQDLRHESQKRESKLTNFINEITKQFERLATSVERLTLDVDEIKDELKLRKERTQQQKELP